MTSRDPSASSPVSSADCVSRAETARRQGEIEATRLFNLSLDLLALAIVRGHAGFIDVESEPGRGSRFRVHLPATPAGTDDTGPHSLPRGGGELVLVVDDDAPVCERAGRTLEAFGYPVVLAHDGAQAAAVYAERLLNAVRDVLDDQANPV